MLIKVPNWEIDIKRTSGIQHENQQTDHKSLYYSELHLNKIHITIIIIISKGLYFVFGFTC